MAKLEKATFGAGCFWHVEDAFMKIRGVKSTAVGFMGGRTKDPNYKDVSSDKTGHIETIQIEFDPKIVPYEKLLEVFWRIHDPTTMDRQGPDIGSQYRSVIFYQDESQKEKALQSKTELEKERHIRGKVVTEIRKAEKFYKAEEAHQKYFEKNSARSCSML